MITNDATLFGILAAMLGVIFYTSRSEHAFWKSFYRFVPVLLVCYFLPSLLNSTGLVDPDKSNLYFVASRFLLPASLVLLTLSIDFKKIMALGPKALIMFITGTLGVVIGGPIALLLMSWFDPSLVGGQGPEAIWRGMTTIAGSWIGGGANQAAMKEIYKVPENIFSMMVTVDVIVANIWMAVLLFFASRSESIDKANGADNSAIVDLRKTVQEFHKKNNRIPEFHDLLNIFVIGFVAVGIAHWVGDSLSQYFSAQEQWKKSNFASQFFWLIVVATSIGLLLSFTKVKKLEGVGASKVGSVFIYILVATIGMKMDVTAILKNKELFILGAIWISFHALLLFMVMKLIKAPFFFMAVGSQANIGGAASAPVVASAFHPALAPVGVLLAVLGYAVGTYAALLTGYLLKMVAP